MVLLDIRILLSDNELLALVRRLTKLYTEKEGLTTSPLSDDEIVEFLTNALSKTGAEEMITPREIIRDYLTLLNIMRDNKGVKFSDFLDKLAFVPGADSEGNMIANINQKTVNKKIDLFDIDI